MLSMYAAELLAKLRHLTLVGQDEDGELEWAGTERAWQTSRWAEKCIYEFSNIWK